RKPKETEFPAIVGLIDLHLCEGSLPVRIRILERLYRYIRQRIAAVIGNTSGNCARGRHNQPNIVDVHARFDREFATAARWASLAESSNEISTTGCGEVICARSHVREFESAIGACCHDKRIGIAAPAQPHDSLCDGLQAHRLHHHASYRRWWTRRL